MTAGAAGTGGTAGAPSGPLSPLVGSVQPLPAGAQVLGPTATGSPVHVEVSLKPRDPSALAAFAHGVATPGDPLYGHYLAPGGFASKFGPDDATVASTRGWLARVGLTVGSVAADHLLIPVTGTAAQIERAFGVRLVDARLGSGRVARATIGAPEVPSSLAPSLQGVIGLSTVAEAHPQIVAGPTGSGSAPSGTAGGAVSHGSATAHAGPAPCATASAAAQFNGAWTADQLASAYGLSTLYAQERVAAGQRVAVYELEPFTPSDIQTYQSCYGLSVPVSTVSVDGGPGDGAQSGEAALDIEMVAGLAPSSSITVYAGPNYGAGPIDTYSAMVNVNPAPVISTSWGVCEGPGGISPAEQATETSLFQQATAQHQTIVAASGDAGSSDCYNPLANPPDYNQNLYVDDPADQPDVTGVGGTSLTAVSTVPPAESVWNGGAGGGSGGGGLSKDFVAPSWQQSAAVQTPFTTDTCGPAANQQCRQVPDVAASADPRHGAIIYVGGSWRPFGGTSTAAPLWAALTADINQGCATPAGLLNQKLYAAGAAGSPPVNDVTSGNNDLFNPGSPTPSYPATAGYDLASGWGSPRAAALIGTLTGSAAGCPAVSGLSPTSGPATGGRTVVISGTGFGTGSPSVRFGGVPAQIVSHSPTSITVVTPSVGTGRQVPVTVTTSGTAGGTSAAVPVSEYTFVSPQVTAVVPSRGPTGGGGRVTIEGSDFAAATSVRFGSTPASFTVQSANSLTAVAPPGPPSGATVDVSVTSPDGTSPQVPADRYTYARPGYWLVASDGGLFAYGAAGFYGSTGNLTLNRPVVGMAATPDDGGYWLVASDGGLFAYGDAGFYGSTGNLTLNRPVVGMAATPDGAGYWLVASDGGLFAYGDAGFYGSTGNLTLNRPVVGMAATPDGAGYWLVASDGGLFAYGDAGFYGSTGNLTLNRPVVGMAATPDGAGYWLVASDGGLFAYGDAGFYGSAGNLVLNEPVVGMASSLTGLGYWLVASDGGLFAYGDAGFYGSAGGMPLSQPVVGMAST